MSGIGIEAVYVVAGLFVLVVLILIWALSKSSAQEPPGPDDDREDES